MNRSNLVILTIILISVRSFGQESQYFTMHFQEKTSEKTGQQRKYVKSDNQISTEDYKDNKLAFSGVTIGTVDVNEVDDFLFYIRSLGNENKYKASFKDYEGKFIFFYQSGPPCNEVLFRRAKILYTQVWTEDGKEQLTSGTGFNKLSSEDYEEDIYQEYKDSLLTAYYSIRRTHRDTIYAMVDKQAEPKEGIQAFYQHLVKVLKYPLVARFVGKEGRVLIQFLVDEKGKLTEFNPRTKEGYGFETKIIQKLSAFPNWNPAVYKGRFVKMRFVLPITYKLTN